MALRVGMQGEAVARVQEGLRSAGFDAGPIDGKFGASTEAAVREFQISQNMTADGIVGPKTWEALGLAGEVPEPAAC